MDGIGFTPWELASLKVMFHRFDDRHKGFLDADDIRRLCAACDIPMEGGNGELMALFRGMDTDGDLRLSFDEFVCFLALAGSEHPKAVHLRAQMLGEHGASLAAGAALGALPVLKGKVAVLLGTLFYDPVRLFRDTFVDYASTLRSRWQHQSRPSSDASLVDIIRQHYRETHLIKTAAWLLYSISLDCAVGVAMFLTYSSVRRRCIECAETLRLKSEEGIHRRNGGGVATEEDPSGTESKHDRLQKLMERLKRSAVSADTKALREHWDEEVSHVRHTVSELPSLVERTAGIVMHGHPLRLEATAGFAGGAVAGLCEQPCRYLASFGSVVPSSTSTVPVTELPSSSSSSTMRAVRQHVSAAFHHTPFHMFRSSIGHAVFFSVFSGTKAFVYRNAFGAQASCFQLQRTSVRDSVVTAVAGCTAGASYRLISVPLTNMMQQASASKLAIVPWMRQVMTQREGGGLRALHRCAFKGLGESLMFTMPVTGVAFLVYEVTLLHT